MDIAAASPRRPRPDTHYRRWTPSTQSHVRQRREPHRKEGHPREASDVPPAHKEKERQQGAMTKDHRLYHRRQAAAAIKTVAVEVVATVDNAGNVVAQETKTQGDPIAPTLGAAVNAPPAAAPAVSAVVDAVPSAVPPPAESPVVNALQDIAPAPPAPASPALPPAVPIPPVPTLPQVPAVPSGALPVVPAVPPFPSDLNVPAYPYASGVPAAAAQVSSGSVTSSPAPTSVTGSSAIPASVSSIPLIGSNSTITSTSSFSSVASRASKSSAISSMSDFVVSVDAFTRSSSSVSQTASSSSSSPSSSSHFSSVTASPYAPDTTFYGGVGNGGPASTAADPAQATAGAAGNSPGSTTPLQTPQVVGSVVGSLAGAALVLAIILLLLQRHKRQRRGALQLTNDETADRSPPMAQDASRNNRIPSAFLNRFSSMSRSTVETSTSAGEKSFQRVSGRKLPSAFSEGMTSEQFSRGAALSGSSFYTDDNGTYGGPGFSKDFAKEAGATPIAAGMMNIRPGPARTPVIRHPDEDLVNPFDDPAPFPRHGSHLSPPQSPNPDAPRSTLGRSLQSADGSRSSKFTENV
jgi:hypothetical protein